jgi:hypothetical protein
MLYNDLLVFEALYQINHKGQDNTDDNTSGDRNKYLEVAAINRNISG